MTERPILFSDAMVRAILAGTKTQTRRVVKPNPRDGAFYMLDGWPHRSRDGESNRMCGHEEPYACPYGAQGDRLWVREAWGVRASFDFTDWRRDTMRGCTEAPPGTEVDFRADYGHQQEACFWRPSIHMPRWVSRLTLEVTSVRVERVQSISEDDARAEGVTPAAVGDVTCWRAFRVLWDSINGEREGCSWTANPWVWVVGFRRATP